MNNLIIKALLGDMEVMEKDFRSSFKPRENNR